MDEENLNNSNESSQHKSNASLKDTFKSGTPDEVRDRVRDTVEKGVAAVAGALKGFNRETERSKLPEETKGAIHQVAETAKSTVSSVTEEAQGLRQPLKEAGQKLSSTAKDLTSTLREQVDETKSAVKGSKSSYDSSDSSLGSSSSAIGSSAFDRTSSMGMGGSDLGTSGTSSGSRSSTGLGTELPDISKTPLAQSDRKLIGKDLTEDLEE